MAISEEEQKLISLLHPKLRSPIVDFINTVEKQSGLPIKLLSTFRSIPDQEKLYAKGRDIPGKVVTYSIPGKSWHNYGLAADFCWNIRTNPYLVNKSRETKQYLMPPAEADKKWEIFGQCAENNGFSWGGRWMDEKRDKPHIQMTFGLTINEAFRLYDLHGSIDDVWKVIDRRSKK